MENIYFQPNKENSEFLAKLEKLDEYTIPQILERMVDHFRNLPELEDALNKLGIKTDSLKDDEELDDDIEVKETFYVGGKPKKLRHFKGDDPTPVLAKEWYKNGQLEYERLEYSPYGEINDGDMIYESISFHENGKTRREYKRFKNRPDYHMEWYDNGQLSHDKQNNLYFDKEGNKIDYNTWMKTRSDHREKMSNNFKLNHISK